MEQGQKIEFVILDMKFTGPIKIKDHEWKTATGKLIKVRKMGSNHIKACIKLMENGRIPESYAPNDKWLKIFNKELTLRQ